MSTKANLLQKLNSGQNTYISFQCYADDLIKQLSNKEGWRVVPSKYVVCELNSTALEDGSNYLPRVLQNYYENKVAFIKDQLGDNITNNDITACFWSAAPKFLGDLEDFENTELYPEGHIKFFKQIKYIGDINVDSEVKVDGQAYNEIYVYIPEDAKRARYGFKRYESGLSWEYKSDKLNGWEEQYPSNAPMENTPILDADGTYTLKDIYMPNFEADPKSPDNYTNTAEALDDTDFTFNAIIVLYDILYNEDGKIVAKYKGIPMGIYVLDRPITKYVSNDDIYGQGTAYGFRLNMKYVSQPAMSRYDDTVGEADKLDSITGMLKEYANASKLMMKVVDTNAEHLSMLKDHLAMFRNYRVNVPYILKVNGMDHWFVNGRDLGPSQYIPANEDTN